MIFDRIISDSDLKAIHKYSRKKTEIVKISKGNVRSKNALLSNNYKNRRHLDRKEWQPLSK